MRTRLAATLLAITVLGSAPGAGWAQVTDPGFVDAEQADRLTLMNKDVIRGALVSAVPSPYGLRWQHRWIKDAIYLSTEGVSSIELGQRHAQTDAAAHTAAVTLSNGDQLLGEIVSLSADALLLRTSYAGDVTILRAMLKRIDPTIGVSSVAYEGPKGLDGWAMSRRNNAATWKYKKGRLYSVQQATIGRMLETFPDKANIEFYAAWRAYPAFSISFYTDNLQSVSGNCYMMQVSGASGYMYRYSTQGGAKNLGSMSLPQFKQHQPGRVRVQILADKAARTFTFLIDGSVVKSWTDANAFAGGGTGLVFYPHSHRDLRISGIRVSEWDGKIPEQGEAVKRVEEDLIRFINRDKISGKLKSIADETVIFETPYATLTVPIKRVTELIFSDAGAERARRRRNDVRAEFREMGSVTFDLVDLQNNVLQGKSDNFTEIGLPLYVLKSLDFNIYKEKAEPDDDF